MVWKFLVLYTGNLRNSDVIKFPRNRMERGFKVNFSRFNFQNFSQLEVQSQSDPFRNRGAKIDKVEPQNCP